MVRISSSHAKVIGWGLSPDWVDLPTVAKMQQVRIRTDAPKEQSFSMR